MYVNVSAFSALKILAYISEKKGGGVRGALCRCRAYTEKMQTPANEENTGWGGGEVKEKISMVEDVEWILNGGGGRILFGMKG